MKKFLRFSLIALFAVLGINNMMAQEVTLDFSLETESGSKVSVWGFPASSANKTVAEQSFSYDGYTVKVAGSSGQGYYWHDKDHYLLAGKQGAYVILPAFDFDVERIDVEVPSGASASVKQNIFVGDDAVSTETTGNGTKNFVIAEDKQAAGTIYTLKVVSNHNTQIKKILIYKKGSSVKKPAGIAWNKATASVTFGNPDDTYKYLPTFSNPNELDVTFASSNSEVISISTEGKIEVEGEGEAILTASFAGNDEYEEAEVTCKVTVNPAPSDEGVTIAEFAELSNNTIAKLKLTNAVVLGIGGGNIVVKDETGSLLIFDKNNLITASQGYTISGTIDGKKTVYGGLLEIKDLTATDLEVTENTITATQIALNNIEGQEYMTNLWEIKDVVIKKDGDRFYLMNGETKILQIYDEFKTNALTAEGTYTVEGLRGKYNTTEQFWITKVTETSGISAQTIDADANAPMYNLKGERVDANYRGVVIKAGKKTIQK